MPLHHRPFRRRRTTLALAALLIASGCGGNAGADEPAAGSTSTSTSSTTTSTSSTTTPTTTDAPPAPTEAPPPVAAETPAPPAAPVPEAPRRAPKAAPSDPEPAPDPAPPTPPPPPAPSPVRQPEIVDGIDADECAAGTATIVVRGFFDGDRYADLPERVSAPAANIAVADPGGGGGWMVRAVFHSPEHCTVNITRY